MNSDVIASDAASDFLAFFSTKDCAVVGAVFVTAAALFARPCVVMVAVLCLPTERACDAVAVLIDTLILCARFTILPDIETAAVIALRKMRPAILDAVIDIVALNVLAAFFVDIALADTPAVMVL